MDSDRPPGKPIGRRVVIGAVGLAAIGTVVGESIQSVVGKVLSPIASTGGSGLGALIPGASRFQIYTIIDGFPAVAASSYRLSITGLVKKPVSLNLNDLKSMPPTKLVKPFQCVTGWRVPSVEWKGVLLGDLLNLVEPTSAAKAVHFTSYDGAYTESLTMDQARRYDVIVAYEMLDAPVTREHGGPVRLYVAPMYGYKSIKWLKGIQVLDEVVPGYWEQNGYDVNAWIGDSNGRAGDVPVD